MRITIEVNQPTWLVDRPRLKAVLTLVVVLGLLVIPGTVIASHQFADVPNNQPFHTQIGAIKDAGITSGSTECGTPPPGQTFYCPESLVRRDAMAAFMHRGYGRAGVGESVSLAVLADNELLEGPIVVVDTGGVAGGTGFVAVTGTVTAVEDGGLPCPCQVRAFLAMSDLGGAFEEGSREYFDDISATGTPSGFASTSLSATHVFAVPTGTQKEFKILYRVLGTTGGADETVDSVEAAITAIFVPFSNDGDDTLATIGP